VRISLEAGAGTARLEMLDDGVGCSGEAGGSGLRGLRERVEARGGRLEFGSPSGGGFRLAVKLPLGSAPTEAAP